MEGAAHRGEAPGSLLATRYSPDERSKVAVLIPAAGRGARLGGKRKQLRMLGGASLLVHTLRVFDRHSGVGALVVAAPAEKAAAGAVESALRAEGLSKLAAVVTGGASRQASVRAALESAPETADLVLVHDAVRPFIAPEDITAVIDAARARGAAALAVPVTDTVRRGTEDGCFGKTVPRAGLYRMQTPQGFRRAWLAEAHARAAADGFSATDDVELVQRLGYAVHIVEGDARNIKITTPADWALAQLFWQEMAVG